MLGNPRLQAGTKRTADAARAAMVKAVNAKAAEYADIIASLQADGRRSLRELAEGLNSRGFRTPRNSEWTATAVRRLLARLGGQTGER